MIQLFKMAFRDLGRNRRRSFFSALALGMGLALLLLMAAVIEGEMRGAMELTIRLQSGHLQVRAKTYDEDKTSLAWEDLVEDPEAVAAQIATLPPVQRGYAAPVRQRDCRVGRQIGRCTHHGHRPAFGSQRTLTGWAGERRFPHRR